ncbi:aminoglycoside phosphotransferase family protein [Paenibacillus sp. OSY-SE]|uniref:aminoglycoside phosphotransferase family protein n=1 Tax=Paenibacillus sp. OSY-SE TaxID=1196323 RepID=UPI00030F8891|nr:aminoglycoside phosphotransferase family protein [Paenibacillus sp. OSY-SE]
MMKPIGQGRTADIFEYQKDKIMKLYHQGFPEDAVNQEFLISKFIYSLGIHTPQAYELTDVDSRQGIVFQRIAGSSLLNIITKKPWQIKKHARTLASLHANIHTHHAAGNLRNQKQVLSGSIQATPLLTKEEKKKTIHYLEQLPPGDMLCHGDFHPDNVMVGEEHWIIDWMTGMSGNPAGDVARTFLLLNHGTMPDGTPKLLKAIINFLRNNLKHEYMKHYLSASGLAYSEIDRWILPVAAARLVEWIPKEEKDTLIMLVKDRLRALS